MPETAAALGLPPTAPWEAQFHPDRQLIAFVYRGEPADRTISLEANALAALLIAYCVRARIALPKHASKTIRVETAAVVLGLMIRIDEVPLQVAAPKAASQAPTLAPGEFAKRRLAAQARAVSWTKTA